MKKYILIMYPLFSVLLLQAQKREEGFSSDFKPTTYPPRYYVVTEKVETLWHRQAWYLPEQTMALDAWYKDSAATILHGTEQWYHTSKYLRSKGQYINGKKEGVWLQYNEEGRLFDSSNYAGGRLKNRLQWSSEGYMTDSTQFDDKGNGVQVQWYYTGELYAAGRWVADTLKNGRWKYYHNNGSVMATEDYVNGNKTNCHCFDESGLQLDSAVCYEKEAEFPGGSKGWIKFLQKNLDSGVPVRKGAPVGQYTVVVQFIVGKDGTISDVKALTNFGYGMEQEILRVMKRSSNWVPAHQFGKKLKAYRKQPITFVVSQG